jgi:hypothetical protein
MNLYLQRQNVKQKTRARIFCDRTGTSILPEGTLRPLTRLLSVQMMEER